MGLFKINSLFTRHGLDAIHLIHDYNAKVFLDLKYHDIPNTMRNYGRAAAQHGVYLFNVHASAGLAGMKTAVEGARAVNDETKVIAVTVLTSFYGQEYQLPFGTKNTIDEQVLKFAQLVQHAGLEGIVCSGADLDAVKDKLPTDFLYVTPGIKGPNTHAGADQKRVMTPYNAVKAGASILVVGRAITDPRTQKQKDANEPVTKEMQQQAAYRVLQDMARAL